MKSSKARADWIKIYQQLGSISKATRRCGIARSRRPHRLARQKWDDEVVNLNLDIRDTHRCGKIRICSHLLLHHQIKNSPSTIARVLEKYNMKPLQGAVHLLPKNSQELRSLSGTGG